MEKEKILISFSGGETSAYMTKWLLETFKEWKEMIVVFANTGEENEETLNFVNKCDIEYGFNTVWIEADIVNGKGNGTKAKIVDFKTASRNGEPFKAEIAKYGIPNIMYKHCSRELKNTPIRAYARSIGWKRGEYRTAIGIRADEIDRVSENKDIEMLWYPLVSANITKPYINRFWRSQPFRLELKGYQGNCKVCWKKSLRKLLTIAKENPEYFDNFKKWEIEYGNFVNPERKKEAPTLPIRFFRNNLSVDNLMELSKKDFKLASDDSINFVEHIQLGLFDLDLDISNGCVESCEVF
jgi:hypothetical protein